MEIYRGAHVTVGRVGYHHHGIYTGDGMVVHFSGEPGSKIDASVRSDRLADFLDGGAIEIVEYCEGTDFEAAAERALLRVGETGYHLIWNNCEHFARWCVTGEHQSEQVRDRMAGTGVAVGTPLATAGAMAIVSAAGVVGTSGAGIMSGLATVGAIVGGGAVAGLATLSILPGAVGAAATQVILKDDAKLPPDERQARRAGRRASLAGGGAGAVGALVAVSASGTVGLSAAGITSGLAAVGGVVGGGMAAGTAIVVAAPAVAAVATAYGIYRLFRPRQRAAAAEGGGDSPQAEPSGD